MNKRFFRFIKDKKDITGVALVVALGLILIFLGGKGDTPALESDGDLEEKISTACSGVEGVGECEVFLYFAPTDAKGGEEVVSVIVVCEGADSVEVKLRLTNMLSSFFGIGTNRIRIEKMKNR